MLPSLNVSTPKEEPLSPLAMERKPSARGTRGSVAALPPTQPASARGPPREEALLPHEDTVRAVYKKHAQSFFEEIKEGFLREAAALRKQAQKAIAVRTSAGGAWDDGGGGGGAGDGAVATPRWQAQLGALQRQVAELQAAAAAHADGRPSQADTKSASERRELLARLDKQQEELRNLSRHVHSEFAFAKKATLTPMWKERTLQEIAQGELRVVCAEEVGKAFKELAASFDERQVEAAILRLCEAGPMPWEAQLRVEVAEVSERLSRELAELASRSDEGTSARTVLVECCNAIEERQRGHTDRLNALSAELARLREDAAAPQARLKALETACARVGTQCAHLEAALSEHHDAGARDAAQLSRRMAALEEGLQAANDRFAQFDSHHAELRAGLSREADARAVHSRDLGALLEEVRGGKDAAGEAANASGRAVAEAAAFAQEARAIAEQAAAEARAARAEAAAAGGAAARARSEGEAARGLAAGAVEAMARSEASSVQHSLRLGALEGGQEDLRRQAQHNASSQAQALAEALEQYNRRLDSLQAQLEKGAAPPSSVDGLEARGLRRLADGGTDGPPQPCDDEGGAGGPEPAYVAAKLRAHLEFVEVRLKELHRQAEGLGDELGSRQRKLADTVSQHTLRLEAVEGRIGEMHRQTAVLSGELAAHSRKVVDAVAQGTARSEALEDRLRAVQVHAESLGHEVGARLRTVADNLGQHSGALAALEGRCGDLNRQAQQQGDRMAWCTSQVEDMRRDLGILGTRTEALEARQETIRHGQMELSGRTAMLEAAQQLAPKYMLQEEPRLPPQKPLAALPAPPGPPAVAHPAPHWGHSEAIEVKEVRPPTPPDAGPPPPAWALEGDDGDAEAKAHRHEVPPDESSTFDLCELKLQAVDLLIRSAATGELQSILRSMQAMSAGPDPRQGEAPEGPEPPSVMSIQMLEECEAIDKQGMPGTPGMFSDGVLTGASVSPDVAYTDEMMHRLVTDSLAAREGTPGLQSVVSCTSRVSMSSDGACADELCHDLLSANVCQHSADG